MPMNTTRLIWFNGEIVPWEQATVHVMAHALHYGSSIFEGIRCYDTPRGPAIFRLAPHIERMLDSARIYRMALPYTAEQLAAACHEVVRVNELRSAYLRPLAYRAFGEITPHPGDTPVEVAVAAVPWGKFLSDDEERGIDVCVSSWQRPAPNTLPTLAKAGGNYLSSQLIVMRGTAPRICRRHRAGLLGQSQRRLGREPVRRARWCHLYPAVDGGDPDRCNAR